jgi:hypothetical protein
MSACSVSNPYVIVWDLDGTLGDFVPLHGRGESTDAVAVRVRPGLPEALHALSAAGFTHTLLTLATPLYAEVVLRAIGLRQYFVRVEGLGQRDKGDAVGIATQLGIAESERPHRMLFVGDHPLFDEPRDPRVLFHLEPFAMLRPADELTRLVLHLRDAGAGSLRAGFDALVPRERPSWWQRLRQRSWRIPNGRPITRSVPGIGEVALIVRADACPVIGFSQIPSLGAQAGQHTFVPAEMLAQVLAEQAKAKESGEP